MIRTHMSGYNDFFINFVFCDGRFIGGSGAAPEHKDR